MSKKIEVFLRTCFKSPNQSLPNRNRPSWFDAGNVRQNFRNTINPELANYTIIYDSHFDPIKANGYIEEDGMVIIDEGNEAGSFLRTLEYIMSQNYSDDTIIYLLEDDYLHVPNWCEAIVEGLSLSGVDYLSGYDHRDKYLHYPDLTAKLFISNSYHWRTTPSTTNTYACKFGTLKKDIEIHRKHSENCPNGVSQDNAKFINLSQFNRTLVTPIPGFSTHCEAELLSPIIDWEAIINYYGEEEF